jgi:hypothetical protein
MLEKVADQVLDIILTEEETPLQEIIIEQLCKIVAANTRTLWSEARMRSGVLPNGRTLLGTIVDPLGLFQTSPLVNACDQDERTVEMTRELVGLFQSLQTSQQPQQATALLNLQDLDRQELIAFSRILSVKIWERRSSIVGTSNRILRQMLELTAIRLETTERVPVGERRPTLGIPRTSDGSRSTVDSDIVVEEPAAVNTNGETSSARLRAARSRLDSFSQQ